VAEFLLESQYLEQGDEYLVLGETTGALEGVAEDMRVELKQVQRVDKGTYFSIKTPEPIRRNDKLYKMVRVEETHF
jgi:putative protease